MWNAWRSARPLIVLALALASGVLSTVPRVQAGGPLALHEFAQVHMGMPVRLRFYATDAETARGAAATAFARIATLDATMSDYRDDSELRRLSAASGTWVAAGPELFSLLRRAVEIARVTDGAFDPTIGPVVHVWREARITRVLPDSGTIARARSRVGWQAVQFDSTRRSVRLERAGMQLDLGGIAKGYILQEGVAALRQAGITRALAEAGGDIAVSESPPERDGWRIDVTGVNAAFAARAARLANASLATSGPTAQFVEIDGVQYSHVIDPRTGVGLTNHVTAHVIAEDGATADALATALTIADAKQRRRIQSHFPQVSFSIRREAPPR